MFSWLSSKSINIQKTWWTLYSTSERLQSCNCCHHHTHSIERNAFQGKGFQGFRESSLWHGSQLLKIVRRQRIRHSLVKVSLSPRGCHSGLFHPSHTAEEACTSADWLLPLGSYGTMLFQELSWNCDSIKRYWKPTDHFLKLSWTDC